MDWLAIRLLKIELRRWRAAGHTPILWWRDDDARRPSPALDRLLAAAAGRPLALAVVPDGDMEALSERLRQAARVTVSQHGVDHENRRPPGEPPSEYPSETSAAAVAQQIREGSLRLRQAGLEPAFFTPPWNQIDETLAAAIPAAGFAHVSSAVPARDVPGAVRLDSHLDILRWKSAPRFRGYWRVLRSLRRQLRRRRKAATFDEPIGLLTHHLAHDEATWRFLAWLGPFADTHFVWRGFGDLRQPDASSSGACG